MKAWSRTLIAIVFVGLWLAAPQVGSGAPDTGSAPAPDTSAQPQADSPAWIVWETQAPVQRLALDGDSLWVGYQDAGLARWDRETGPQASYSSSDGLPGNDVLSIAVDSSGNKWIATLDGSVARTESGDSFADLTPGAPADHNAWALATHGSEVWLGTLGGGVAHRSSGAWSIDTEADSSLPFDDIYAVAVEPSGTPWVGTLGYGVAARQAGVWTTYDPNPPLTIANPLNPSGQVSNRAITDIAVDGAGNKWFATDGSGVAKLDASNADWTVYNTANSGLSSDFVQSVFVDSSGNKWFGTLDGGVSRLGSGGGWTTYDSGNSALPEDDVLDAAVDGDGGLWLAAYDTGLAYFGDLPAAAPGFGIDPKGEPATPAGASRGYDLWLDPATYQWRLSWRGDGKVHHFQGDIQSDAPVHLLGTDDFEPGDEASSDGDTLSVDAHESSGQDSLTFELDRSATELTVALRIDGAYYPFSIHVGAAGAAPGTAPFRLTAPQPQPPVVDAGPDLTLTEGDFAFFAGSFSDPDSPSGQTIAWDFGDGASAEDTLSPSHEYVDNGTYTATLTVTDVHGMIGSDSLEVAVDNAPPQVDLFTDPFSPNVGESVDFEAVIFDPGSADTHTFEWQFGDDSDPVTTTEPITTHTYAQSGDFDVGVTVTDDDGGVGTAGFTLTVTVSGNQPPQVDAGEDIETEEGTSFDQSISFVDADSEAWTWMADWGDGTPTETMDLTAPDPFDISHTYADNGAYTVQVTVTDSQGAAGSDSFEVDVSNVAPIVQPAADQTVEEGSILSLEVASFADPGTADTHTATIEWGDGSSVEPGAVDEAMSTVAGAHTYADDGDYSVQICVEDDDLGQGCGTFAVTVENAPPVVEAGEDQSVDEGGLAQASAEFVDPGLLDAHTASIDWGDGSAVEAGVVDDAALTVSGNHAYGHDGVYTVEICVTDNDGGMGCDTLTVTVDDLPPSLASIQDRTADEGDLVELQAAFSDPGFLDTHSATINWGDGGGPEPMTVNESDGQWTAAAEHRYGDNGDYSASVEICDDEGACASEGFTVHVLNVAPSVDLTGHSIDEGQSATLHADVADPGVNDTHTAQIDWGDGNTEPVEVQESMPGGTISATHVYGDNGSYDVSITVTDDDGGAGSGQTKVDVANLDPSVVLDTTGAIELSGDAVFVGRAGEPQTHSAQATDPGSDDLTFTWNSVGGTTYFNNGTSADPPQSPDGVFPFAATDESQLVFDSPGMYDVTVTVSDDDDGSGSDSLSKLITGANTCVRGQGYWKHQFSGNGKADLSEESLRAYLELVNRASTYFSDLDLSKADDVMQVKGQDMRPNAEAQLLAAWLNFANGAVGWDQAIDVDGSGMAFHTVMAEAEDLLLNPDASHTDLVRAKDLAEAVNQEDSSCQEQGGQASNGAADTPGGDQPPGKKKK